MSDRCIASILLSLFAALGTSTTRAASCTLDLERAYHVAVARGWTFKCSHRGPSETGIGAAQGLTFDGSKRVGCYGRNGPTGKATFQAQFLRQGSGSTSDLRGGWRVQSFEVSGGQYSGRPPIDGVRIFFEWSSPTPGATTRRFLSKLLLEKSGGQCAKVYDEAFG